MPATSMEQVVNLAKRRGYVFPASEIYGCTEWHTCHCDDTCDVDPDTVPDFPFTVGRPDMFGGSSHTTLEAAKSHARSLSAIGQRMAVKTRAADGHDEIIAHLFENGREVKE